MPLITHADELSNAARFVNAAFVELNDPDVKARVFQAVLEKYTTGQRKYLYPLWENLADPSFI